MSTSIAKLCQVNDFLKSLVLDLESSIVNGNINPQDKEGMSPVHCAAQFGSAKHIALMIEGIVNAYSIIIIYTNFAIFIANCDFSVVDIERKTVLHWTVDNKDMTCLHAIVNHSPYLLNRQYVSITVHKDKTIFNLYRDINGQTLLHISSKKGNGPLVEQLLNIDGYNIIIIKM